MWNISVPTTHHKALWQMLLFQMGHNKLVRQACGSCGTQGIMSSALGLHWEGRAAYCLHVWSLKGSWARGCVCQSGLQHRFGLLLTLHSYQSSTSLRLRAINVSYWHLKSSKICLRSGPGQALTSTLTSPVDCFLRQLISWK